MFIKRSLIVIAVILVAASVSWAAHSDITFKTVTAEDLKAEMQSGKSKVFIVDARTAEEFRQGHLPWAINVPPKLFSAMAGSLPRNRTIPLVFYCRGYNCTLSQSAAMEALRAGYTNIRLYRGGYPEWSQKGYKVVR